MEPIATTIGTTTPISTVPAISSTVGVLIVSVCCAWRAGNQPLVGARVAVCELLESRLGLGVSTNRS